MKLNRRKFLQLLGLATAGVLVAPKPKIFDLGKTVAILREPKILIAADPALERYRADYSFTTYSDGMFHTYFGTPNDKKWRLAMEYPLPPNCPAPAMEIVQRSETWRYRWAEGEEPGL